MPTLFRLLVIIAVLVGLAYAAMWALVTYVQPEQHEITQTVTLPKQAP